MSSVHAPARPAPAPPAATPASRPLTVSTCLLVSTVAAAGLVLFAGLAVVGWIVGSGSGSSGQAVRTGALVWLGAHGATVSVGAVRVSLVPLLAPLLIGIALLRGCRWAVASSARGSGLLPVGMRTAGAVAAGAGCYGLVVVLVGWGVRMTATPGAIDAGVWRGAALAVVAVAVTLAVGLGVADGGWRAAGARRAWLRAVVAGAGATVTTIVAAAAVVVAALLATSLGEVWAIGRDVTPGVLGGIGLALLCLALLPNAVLWAAAYLLGPGFAVGGGTVVAPGGVAIGALPALPLFAALPAPGPPVAWAWVLTVLPIVAGVLGGAAAARSLPDSVWWRQALAGAGAGLAAGLVLALLLLLSGGSIGPDRMQHTGPLPAALVVGVLTLVMAAAAGAVAHRALGGWRPGWPRLAGRLPGRLPGWLHRPR